MSIVMTNADEHSDSSLSDLAEKVFVEFSAEPKIITHGQSLSNPDQHYQMTLEGRDEYEFEFSYSTFHWTRSPRA